LDCEQAELVETEIAIGDGSELELTLTGEVEWAGSILDS